MLRASDEEFVSLGDTIHCIFIQAVLQREVLECEHAVLSLLTRPRGLAFLDKVKTALLLSSVSKAATEVL